MMVRWICGLAGAVLIAVTPYLWLDGRQNLLWITIPLILIWCVWLVLEYLRWARKLGKH